MKERIIDAIIMFIIISPILSTLVLSILKLYEIINWSWLWVTSPLWIVLVAIVVMFAIMRIITVYGIIKELER